VWCLSRLPRYGLAVFLYPGKPEKAVILMDVMLYIRNLAKSTTEEELKTLFTQAGEVTSVKVMKNQNKTESRGFAFLTMSAQSEADSAVSKFNFYSFGDHELKVNLVKPREQRGGTLPYTEP
jgi:RNA recognition motif-containing protein